MSTRQRTPFGDAPADIGNRHDDDEQQQPLVKGKGTLEIDQPAPKLQKIEIVNNDVVTTTDIRDDHINDNDDTDHLALLHTAAHQASRLAYEMKQKNDDELMEAMAQELESIEKELANEKSQHLLQKELWDQRESELLKKLEKQRVDLNNAKKDAKEGIAIVRDLDKGLRGARAERNEARMQVATLQAEIKQMQENAERTSSLMEERQSSHVERCATLTELECLKVQLERVETERNDAIAQLSELSSLRKEVEGINTKCHHLEQSKEELQQHLEAVQSESSKKMEQLIDSIAETEKRENAIKKEHEDLRHAYDNQTDLFDDIVRRKAAVVEENNSAELRMQVIIAPYETRQKELTEAIETQRAQFDSQQKDMMLKLSELQKHKKILKDEVSHLRKKYDECALALQNAEAKMVSLQQESVLQAASSTAHIEELEKDLERTRTKNRSLRDGLKDCEAALTVVSSSGRPPRSPQSKIRKQIEDNALKEYFTQRMH
jgi:chromosome segregation ATPase